MADALIQVSDLAQINDALSVDFLHLKAFADNGDYKITIEDFASDLSGLLGLGDFSTINQADRVINSGNGLTGGGALTSSLTITLGTPGTITRTSGNTTTSTSHTHSIDSSIAMIKGGVILFDGTFIGRNPVPMGESVADTSWEICDGNNGTPDMRDRVPVGSGNLYTAGSTGGSKDAVVVSHNHSATTIAAANHRHFIANTDSPSIPGQGGTALNTVTQMTRRATSSNDPAYYLAGTATEATVGNTAPGGAHNHSVSVVSAGVSGTDKNLQPYYAIAFIKKIS